MDSDLCHSSVSMLIGWPALRDDGTTLWSKIFLASKPSLGFRLAHDHSEPPQFTHRRSVPRARATQQRAREA
jgi:hypothetical protein